MRDYTPTQAAKRLGVTLDELERLRLEYPTLPRTVRLRTGELRGIPRDGLEAWRNAVRYTPETLR